MLVSHWCSLGVGLPHGSKSHSRLRHPAIMKQAMQTPPPSTLSTPSANNEPALPEPELQSAPTQQPSPSPTLGPGLSVTIRQVVDVFDDPEYGFSFGYIEDQDETRYTYPDGTMLV